MAEFLKDKPLILATLSACFGFIFAAGLYKQSIESRLEAHEKDISAINEEMRFRIQLRAQIMDKLDKIEHRLSMIEGKLDSARYR